jgi:glutamate dehydrogenase
VRIWYGEAESDSFNRLLLGSRLSWREIALLRAYACYLGQINFPYSRAYIAETMADHLAISSSIVELFLTRFSPVFDGDDDWRASARKRWRNASSAPWMTSPTSGRTASFASTSC